MDRRHFFRKTFGAIAVAVAAPYLPTPTPAPLAFREFSGVWDVSWKRLQDSSKGQFAFASAVDMLDASMRQRVQRMLNESVANYESPIGCANDGSG